MDRFLSRNHNVFYRLVWARGQLRLADNIDSDDANLHPVHLHDGIGLNIVRRALRGKGGDADLGLDVGRW